MNTAPIELGHTLYGNGAECVLVLHDWLGDRSNYDAILPYLDTAAFTYVFADLRGHGASRGIAGDYTVAEIAGDCLALADTLGWQRFHVIGHSMTGMTTERLAADAPSRIKSAVAVCPVSAAGNRLDTASLAFFKSTTVDDEALRRLFRFVSAGLSTGWVEAKLRQNRARIAPECRLPYLAMLTGADFVADVQGLGTPFLVLIAENDPGLDEAAMRKTFLAWHANAHLATIPNSGHYPMQECPPYFVSVVEAFMRAHA
jgi:pimeloyl-ACP methyl ester carboxylesterase